MSTPVRVLTYNGIHTEVIDDSSWDELEDAIDGIANTAWEEEPELLVQTTWMLYNGCELLAVGFYRNGDFHLRVVVEETDRRYVRINTEKGGYYAERRS